MKSALIFRFNVENKILNRKSFLKSRNNFEENSYSRKLKKTTLTTKIRDVLTTKNYQKSMTKLFLRNPNKASSNVREKRI